ncbi:MAG: methyl-accepting chemotaxis protein [Desulfovibrionaceae bacterium]
MSNNAEASPFIGGVLLFAGLALGAWALRAIREERKGAEALQLWVEQVLAAAHAPQTDFDKIAARIPQIRELDAYLRQLAQAEQEIKSILEQERQRTERAHSTTATVREQAENQREQGLRATSDSLSKVIDGIEQGTEQIQIATGRAGAGAKSQNERLTSAASATEEMSATVREVAGSADEAADHAHKARDRAQEGAAVVDRTVEAIQDVARHAEDLNAVVSELGNQAHSIAGVMELISDIADQTNLLALNAAIEAARAGEAGRGFAVVADEVRKLAEKTMNATREVHVVIQAIQDGVHRSCHGMSEASLLVGQAVNMARESRQSLENIVDLSEASANRIQSIAVAAVQQSKASVEINRIILEVSRIATSTSLEMSGTDQAVATLADQVRRLASLNHVFELVGSGTPRKVVQDLASSPEMHSLDRERQETLLRRTIARHPFLELLYATDAVGIQTVPNIARPEHASPSDMSALGRNWSARPWFQGAVQSGSFCISEIYVSETSGEQCITISIPMRATNGRVVGIVAADVRIES